MLIAQTGGIYSIVRLITVFLLFLFVLGITYFTSRYIALFQKRRMGSGNIEIIEAARINQGTVLEIVKAGDKYLLISVSKDGARLITELDKDSLTEGPNAGTMQNGSEFRDILSKASERLSKKNKLKDDGRDAS